MLASLWYTFLYQPLINALVWIYSNIAEQNLGWAVVWLTIFLRIVLMPLSVKSIKDEREREKIEKEAVQKANAFKGDRVAQKETIREFMKKHHISPWAKFTALAIQLLVLVLLYQVFISGIEGRKIVNTLYDFIDYPGKLNVMFYGFNIGLRHDYVWAGIVAIYLVVMILWSNKDKKWDNSKAAFLILFPLASFFALYYLPMVKSIFILTSMIFSDILLLMANTLFPVKKKEKKA